MAASPLLNPRDPNPVRETFPEGCESPFVLIGDHAGAAIPEVLGNLGLSAADRARHIALDIGIEQLGQALAARLGAPFLSQAYSRLVIDCNRDPAADTAMPEVSDGTKIPGNIGLSEDDRLARRTEIFDPYHRAIEALLKERPSETVLVALHSFTPEMDGKRRPWEIGILHAGHEDSFALAMLEELKRRPGLTVGDNEPYRMDLIDYTVPRHAWPRGLRYAEVEVRQDLLEDAGGVARIENLLAEVLPASL